MGGVGVGRRLGFRVEQRVRERGYAGEAGTTVDGGVEAGEHASVVSEDAGETTGDAYRSAPDVVLAGCGRDVGD